MDVWDWNFYSLCLEALFDLRQNTLWGRNRPQNYKEACRPQVPFTSLEMSLLFPESQLSPLYEGIAEPIPAAQGFCELINTYDSL